VNSENYKTGAGYILICLIWGSTWFIIRAGLEDLTPFFSSGIRFLIATVFIYSLMFVKKIKLQTDKTAIILYLFLGFFSYVIPFGLVYWSEQFIPSGLASVLFSVFPLLVIVFSRFAIPDNQIGISQVIGVLMGFLGVVVIFSVGLSLDSDYNIWAMLSVILSASMQAMVAVVMKKYGNHLHPLSMNFIPVLIGGVFLTLTALLVENPESWRFTEQALLSVGYLALFGTVITFTTYYWLLKRINLVILSLSSFITPIIAVFLGWLIFSESLTIRDLMGSSFVLIGILFANFRGLKKYYLSRLISKHD
jgi:drug/metabolite transporter (DMT)-like permease